MLLRVAFFTLLERKILGGLQFRKGPDKIFFKGLFQPISDGIKLFLKNTFLIKIRIKLLYLGFPFFIFFIILLYWPIYLFSVYLNFFNTLVYFLLISRISVYGVFGRGWVRNSKYGMLGRYRRISQVVSYEVGIIFIVIILVSFRRSYNLEVVNDIAIIRNRKILGFFSCWLIWLVIILAELNRSPFDFAERESELVSGFNVEFGEVKFAFLFLGENGNIIFICYITILLFNNVGYLIFLLYLSIVVLVRGCYPRFRYDNLIYLNWKIFLPFLIYFYILIYITVYFLKI